jgi:bile acid:Na+ symporter, BASS family
MDLKQIVMLALQVSILATVLGFGLKTTPDDLLYVVRRPGLLVRSLIAVFVIMPIAAVILVEAFAFRPAVEIVLVALAISPVPPLLPRKEARAGGQNSYALGLMAILALVSIAAVPLGLSVIEQVFGREFQTSPNSVARVVVKSTLAPLLAGMAIQAFLPAIAARLVRPTALVARVLLPAAVLVLVAGAFTAIWAAVGDGTVLAMVILTLAGLAIGHVLGGPNPEHAVVLALSTACRHPGLALTIAATNYPNQQFGAIILLYLIVNALAGLPYLKWQRRHLAPAVAHAH